MSNSHLLANTSIGLVEWSFSIRYLLALNSRWVPQPLILRSKSLLDIFGRFYWEQRARLSVEMWLRYRQLCVCGGNGSICRLSNPIYCLEVLNLPLANMRHCLYTTNELAKCNGGSILSRAITSLPLACCLITCIV